jgi:hypothetical protein
MPGEDRERTFEKALARHLRANPASEPDARHVGCPDAEILAAYHERMLAPEQLTSWKEHIVLCSRCQEILAQLEATDELPVGVSDVDVEEAEKVLPMVAKSESPVAAREGARGRAVPANAPAVGAITDSPQTAASRRSVRWRWIAPAGAIAAGLLFWIAVRQNHAPEFELAKNQASRVISPRSAPPGQPAPAAPAAPSLEKRQSGAEASTSAHSNSSLAAQYESRRGARADKPAVQDNLRAALKQKASGTPAEKGKTDLDRGELADKSASVSGRQEADANALSSNRIDEEHARKFAREAPAASPSAPTPPPASMGTAVGGIAGTGAREPAKSPRDEVRDDAKNEKKEAPAVAAQTVEIQSETQTTNGAVRTKALPQLMRLARGQAPAVISAPGGKAIWRVGPAGIVEHTSNAGATWKLQKTDVMADLLAGFAPSDEICWIVGRSGTILRTTDRGVHWVKTHAPVEDDLASVFAVDAQQATVFTTSTHQGYRTTDGGLTWAPVTDP